MPKNEYLDMMNAIYKKQKFELTKEQNEKIGEIYNRALKQTAKELKKAKGELPKRYYRNMMRSLYGEMEKLNKENITNAASYALKFHSGIMDEIGYVAGKETNFSRMFNQIPTDVLKKMMAGDIYTDGKGLSARIWQLTKYNTDQIQQIVSAGIAQGTSATKLAKLLEEHVNPAANKFWDRGTIKKYLGKGYAWGNKKIEYNALRLARTSIAHSFTLAAKEATRTNPFLEKFVWRSAFSHGRTCQECMDRDGTIYTTAKLPFDHPNGLCWEEPYFDKDLEYYADRIGNWTDGGKDILLEKWYNKTVLGMSAKDAKAAANAAFSKDPKDKKHYTEPKSDVFQSATRNFRRITDAEASTWDKGYYSDYIDNGLSRTHYDALNTYTASYYRPMNKYLRGLTDSIDPWLKETIDHCKKAIDARPLHEDVIAYRGSSYSILRSSGMSKDLYSKMKSGQATLDEVAATLQGAVIKDDGFMSTAMTTSGSFSGELRFEIKVPKGSKGFYVKKLSEYSHENELLLQAGTKMRIDKIEERSGGYRIFTEVLP